MEMVFNQWDWNAGLPADPRMEAPYFVEVPQFTQAPQTPIPRILPEPLCFYQDPQPASASESERWIYEADRWR